MPAMKCATCHQAPPEEHFSDRCQKCHDPSEPFSEPQLSHPTFGAHVSATQSCLTCHIENGPDKPACRKCHSDDCGKGVTTIGGCLKCHKTGTAKRWIGAPTSPN
jgi:ribosomal protein L40E